MSDIDALRRFTPAPAGLDRDELLFRAGRASARPNRSWKIAVAVLTAMNAATLALMPSRPIPPPPPAPPAPVWTPPDVPMTPPDPSSYLALMRQWEGGDPPPLPLPPASAVSPPAEPLTAGSRLELN